jgi:hypothetical protein
MTRQDGPEQPSLFTPVEHVGQEPTIDATETSRLYKAMPPRSRRRQCAKWELSWVRAWKISLETYRLAQFVHAHDPALADAVWRGKLDVVFAATIIRYGDEEARATALGNDSGDAG